MYCAMPKLMFGKLSDKGYFEGNLIPFQPYDGCKYRGEFIKDWYKYQPVPVACSHCVACQHNRKLQINLLLQMELRTTIGKSSFITLTYNDENLPHFGLNTLHVSRFFKSLKQWLRREYPELKLKYFNGFEYGSKTYRPHYHSVIFGFNPYDFEKISYEFLHATQQVPSSQLVDRFWNKGFNYTMPCNNVACMYVAGYTEKKLIRCTSDYLDRITRSTAYRKKHTELPRLLNPQDKKCFVDKDYRDFVREYNKQIIKEYGILVDEKGNKEWNPEFCHGRCIKFKNVPYKPAEKVYSSNGLGDDYFKQYQSDFYRGYVNSPDGSGVKCKIPNKFVEKLRLINPDWYDNYKRDALFHVLNLDEIQEQHKKDKIYNSCINAISARILDVEPASNADTLIFEELE